MSKKKLSPFLRALIGNPRTDYKLKLLPSLLKQRPTRSDGKDVDLPQQQVVARYNTLVRYYYLMLCLAALLAASTVIYLLGENWQIVRALELFMLSVLTICFAFLALLRLWAHSMVMNGKARNITLRAFFINILNQPSLLMPTNRTYGTGR